MAETITSASLQNALKVYADSRMRKQFNNYSFLHERIKRTTGKLNLGGRTFEISLRNRGGGSWRSLNEMELLPRAGSPDNRLATVAVRTCASVFRISVQGWRASKGNERAWIEAKTDAMKDLAEQFAQRCGQMWYRKADGAVARVNGAPAGQVVTVDANMSAGSNNTFGVDYLDVENSVSASANLAGNEAERTFDGVITDVDEANLQFTINGQIGDLADGDYIFLGQKSRTSKNRDMNGLLNIVDDGTIAAVLHNIDRTGAGNAYWQANRQAAVGGADLENIFQTIADDIARRNRGTVTDIITTYGVRRRFVNSAKNDRMFVTAGESGNYKTGFDSIGWRDGSNRVINVWVDKDCPAQTAFLLDWSTLALGNLGRDADWLNETGEGILKQIDEVLGYQGVYFMMGNLVCYAPNQNGVALGITEN